jgi:cyanate lyase
LEIKNYEIKELRHIQNLIERDRSDFEKFLDQKKSLNISYSDITNTPGLAQILQQVLQLSHQSIQQQQIIQPRG